MSYKTLPLKNLLINRANDRHGELENETAAIAWLFNNREAHMRNLTRDLARTGEVYEPPLVSPDGNNFIVFDGNRRITCLKLLDDPRRAPTVELQDFFREQRAAWQGDFPAAIVCQVETDRDRIDDILFRRHTGTQSGVGQSTWDDRMKDNFVQRTGKGGGLNVADEIEKLLAASNRLPGRKKIPRSTLNRLLSAEAFRNRVGITVARGKLELTHDEPVVLSALQRIASDLASREIVLGDLWDVDGKRSYLDKLEREGVLPTAEHTVRRKKSTVTPTAPTPKPAPIPKPARRKNLIPHIEYGIAWAGRIARHKMIWEELQFHLDLSIHANAISVLFRVLLELSIENYIKQTNLASINPGDKLAQRALKVGMDLHSKGKISDKDLGIVKKLPQQDNLFSMDTLNRYVHSSTFAPSPEHLAAMWDTTAFLTVHCLTV
ncbi:hypothetical protein EI171_11395 [Bradyrhizobium sp. LCT2]|uniref:hypothetical protein n=1 Tax=Bradyrhizobium sp. LCT2 TaxID=2493093 RepID=UPI00137433A1|nr:hypothetical protein [Bradyrhizobium sp. LCT2]QHP67913.1 hypothetical protein EI171_11395 [Bradyrhizobium sp. LCT2]